MSELKARQERYEGTVVQVGNSRGIRLPAGFFNAHTEFSGKVQVTVVAEGAVLLSAKTAPQPKKKADEGDPVVASFLRFLEQQMTKHPEDIVTADSDQMRRIGKLVKGVKVK
jgi:antitoxin PrlF